MPSTRLPDPRLSDLRARRSAKWSMQEPDVIPLSIAETDFDLAPAVRDALRHAIDVSDTGYAEIHEVRSAFADFAAAEYGWDLDPGHVRAVADVGVGVVEFLRAAGVNRVIISSPVYTPFYGWVAESGAELVDVPLQQTATGMRLDLERLPGAFKGGGAYLLCNPQNPTGTVHGPQELAQLAAAAGEHGVVIVSDEIHAPVTFEPARFTPILTVPGAAEHAVALHSASKAWNIAGLKCAVLATPSGWASEIAGRLPPDTRWRVGHFGALASAAAFRDGREWRRMLLRTLQERRSDLAALLSEMIPDLRWEPEQATYLAWIDCSAYGSGRDVAQRCLAEGRVAVEPGERYGSAAPRIRVNYATGHEVLREGVERMANALARHC